MKAAKQRFETTAVDVSRPPRTIASDLVVERRLINEIKWHIDQASTKLDALSKLQAQIAFSPLAKPALVSPFGEHQRTPRTEPDLAANAVCNSLQGAATMSKRHPLCK